MRGASVILQYSRHEKQVFRPPDKLVPLDLLDATLMRKIPEKVRVRIPKRCLTVSVYLRFDPVSGGRGGRGEEGGYDRVSIDRRDAEGDLPSADHKQHRKYVLKISNGRLQWLTRFDYSIH